MLEAITGRVAKSKLFVTIQEEIKLSFEMLSAADQIPFSIADGVSDPVLAEVKSRVGPLPNEFIDFLADVDGVSFTSFTGVYGALFCMMSAGHVIDDTEMLRSFAILCGGETNFTAFAFLADGDFCVLRSVEEKANEFKVFAYNQDEAALWNTEAPIADNIFEWVVKSFSNFRLHNSFVYWRATHQ
jgi:hypothetical protein